MQRVRKQLGLNERLTEQYSGKNITVAVLDTGIVKHPDFDHRVVAFKDFVNHHHDNKVYDDSGHGTHVVGCLAGSGLVSAGRYKGIAPKCNLVIGKVLDQHGDGMVQNMIQGLQWILSQKELFSIRIVNISVGVGNIQDKELEKELKRTIELLWKENILVIAAAGNGGPSPMSLSPIAQLNECIAVGCHDGDYQSKHLCEQYSARGPSCVNLKKPDIVAPGTDILSCNKDYRIGKRGYLQAYIRKSGTSMATPLVSGAAALLFQKYPSLTNEEAKIRILNSTLDLGEPWSKQGWGMLNVGKLLR